MILQLHFDSIRIVIHDDKNANFIVLVDHTPSSLQGDHKKKRGADIKVKRLRLPLNMCKFYCLIKANQVIFMPNGR